MQNRPTVLVIDTPRERSPLLTQYYEYLARAEGALNIVMDGGTNTSIEQIVEGRLDGNPPDYVYWGFRIGTALKVSSDYIKSNNITVVVDVGDVEQLLSENEPANQNFENINIKFLIARWRQLDGFHSEEKLKSFVRKRKMNSELIYVPWGINPNRYKERGLEKDIDVSLVCTISGYDVHKQRREAKRILEEMNDKISVKIGECYYEEYINTLSRSKIFVVEGSNRKFATQKYFEGAACGAMLLGEIPPTEAGNFCDGESIVEVKDYSKIEKQIMYYLEHEDERKRIAKEGKRRVFQNCTVDKVTCAFEERITEDWKRG
jgi:hypothetical protein